MHVNLFLLDRDSEKVSLQLFRNQVSLIQELYLRNLLQNGFKCIPRLSAKKLNTSCAFGERNDGPSIL